MPQARAITFDVGGTLDGPGVPWRPRFEALYRAAGVTEPDEVLARAFYDADDHLHERHALSGLGLTETVRFQVSDTLRNLGRGSELVETIAGAFLREARASFGEAQPVLERLRRDFRLGVISNSYGNMRDVLRHEGLLDFFSVVIDSREIGLDKPDRRIFLAATNALGLPPSSVAHVGDSLPRDVKGARAAGLLPIWYAPDAVREVAEPETIRIRSLGELETLMSQVRAA